MGPMMSAPRILIVEDERIVAFNLRRQLIGILEVVTFSAVLTAEQLYQTSRNALVQAQARRLSDTAALFAALGGGWWNRDDVALENH